jgi:alanine dehydrogenase
MQNIPALFPHSISITISNLASNLFINNNYTNPMDYIKANPKLLHAVITYQQTLTNQIVAEALHLKYKSIDSLLK